MPFSWWGLGGYILQVISFISQLKKLSSLTVPQYYVSLLRRHFCFYASATRSRLLFFIHLPARYFHSRSLRCYHIRCTQLCYLACEGRRATISDCHLSSPKRSDRRLAILCHWGGHGRICFHWHCYCCPKGTPSHSFPWLPVSLPHHSDYSATRLLMSSKHNYLTAGPNLV